MNRFTQRRVLFDIQIKIRNVRICLQPFLRVRVPLSVAIAAPLHLCIYLMFTL